MFRRGSVIVPEALGQALGKFLLLLNQCTGGLGVLIIGRHTGLLGSFEIIGIFHSLLESILIELHNIFTHTGGSNDAAGGAKPAFIVAQLTQSRDIGQFGKTLIRRYRRASQR